MRDTIEPPPSTDVVAPPPLWRRRPWQIAGGAALAALLIVLWLLWALPLGRALEPLPSPTLVLLTADGEPFARRGSYKEEPVMAEELPEHVVQAFLSIEDRRFYDHMGIDLRAIARAMRNNVAAGEVSEGGSTITQQLAKNAFLNNRRTLRRKAQEALIALYLEARLSKNEILSRYLSSVYFGDGVFGLRAAARHYFDKSPDDLTIGEAAMLAGLVKAPSRLAPTEDIEAARERQRVVLAAMVDTGAISQQQARRARNVRVREGRPALPVGSYFADWVSGQAKQAFDRAYGEVEVRTTLDSRLQAQAERIIRRTLNGQGARLNAGQAALVAMRTDGGVVALVGGRDYKETQFNRAVDAVRQPGSAFKLFVYLTALREGATPNSLVEDRPITIGGWSPQNYEEKYAGREITLREAFAKSSNVAAVRVAQEVGIRDVIRTARDLGIERDLPNDATIALGTGEVTLMELTAAYAAVAAGRGPLRPRGLAGFVQREEPRPLNETDRRQIMEMMRAVVTSGTGTAARLPVAAFGKTGTTQDYKDAWFVGFAGDLVVGVWVGNDDNAPMRNVAGGGMPAQIWREFMSAALSAGKIRGFAAAPRREEIEEIDPDELIGAEPQAFDEFGFPLEPPPQVELPDAPDEPADLPIETPPPLALPPAPGAGDNAGDLEP